ncbi:tRNA (guanine(10)-N2)-methyltransferase homolog isoform X2 [Latimeria chalumnae]|uniref:tRNA (guanine(10)-N2)-methyltransferase homolog isoform X2 n=1 Tax=Latimeria chalumnae TaxID=7897 RepID=UPI0006D93294|nr:PREDICTED: tRNA (guanine(10)-N2)-methyltransferase homolog isoform X2 [Latimeria chalumnae]|eukprot:XP_014348366.1 PREDICTED: tRNA (guanine(10)-N2)-methyltransferase homolog isoform X2 [Latimeria chalumnae]
MALSSYPLCCRYLLLLAQENIEFRLPEIKSLLTLCDGHISRQQKIDEKSPFWVLNLPSEEVARGIMKRTVCAKSIFELWGQGGTHKELHSSLKAYPKEKMLPFLQLDSTYKINVYTFNKTLKHQERIARIDALEFLPFQGKVNLKSPEHVFWLLEDYGNDPNSVPEEPYSVYFGRWIADGQRELIGSYSVKKRHFIGNTSMDACLSFIMANHGRVKANDLVFDPFVGTGGLLVSSAHFGAYVCGTDIDYNTVHGLGKASRKNQKWRGPDENIRANLRQYNLENSYIDVLVSDASKTIWKKRSLFDAIITDPPYGIRESTRKTGSHKEITKPAEDYIESHVPASLAYHLSDIFIDLLNLAAKCLLMGGRLVYWLPVYRPEYTEEIIPQHPCLKLISNCEQTLSSHTSRRLITMEKVKEFENNFQCERPLLGWKGERELLHSSN